MSLFDNPKTSDYTELNARLIILEKLFKNFLNENDTTLDEILEIIYKLQNDESSSATYLPILPYKNNILTYLPTFPNTLSTYNEIRRLFNDGNNVFFQYYDTGVVVYVRHNEGDDPRTSYLFNIDKNYNSVQVGTSGANKRDVQIGGENLNLYALNCFNMYLNGGSNYAILFSFTKKKLYLKITVI
jgi:hypothetical protein